MESGHDVTLYLTRYDHTTLTDEEYTRAVRTLDAASRERVGRFKGRADAWS